MSKALFRNALIGRIIVDNYLTYLLTRRNQDDTIPVWK